MLLRAGEGAECQREESIVSFFHTSLCPRVAHRDVSIGPIGSTDRFTNVASLLAASWTWFQVRTQQIAKSRPRASLCTRASRCATRGLWGRIDPTNCTRRGSTILLRSFFTISACPKQHAAHFQIVAARASVQLTQPGVLCVGREQDGRRFFSSKEVDRCYLQYASRIVPIIESKVVVKTSVQTVAKELGVPPED